MQIIFQLGWWHNVSRYTSITTSCRMHQSSVSVTLKMPYLQCTLTWQQVHWDGARIEGNPCMRIAADKSPGSVSSTSSVARLSIIISQSLSSPPQPKHGADNTDRKSRLQWTGKRERETDAEKKRWEERKRKDCDLPVVVVVVSS